MVVGMQPSVPVPIIVFHGFIPFHFIPSTYCYRQLMPHLSISLSLSSSLPLSLSLSLSLFLPPSLFLSPSRSLSLPLCSLPSSIPLSLPPSLSFFLPFSLYRAARQSPDCIIAVRGQTAC